MKKKVYVSPNLSVASVQCAAPLLANTSASGVSAGQSSNQSLTGSSGERERNSGSWGDVWNEGKE